MTCAPQLTCVAPETLLGPVLHLLPCMIVRLGMESRLCHTECIACPVDQAGSVGRHVAWHATFFCIHQPLCNYNCIDYYYNPRFLRQLHVIARAEVAPGTAVNTGELRCGTSMKGESWHTVVALHGLSIHPRAHSMP
jgi:hypothetical protein